MNALVLSLALGFTVATLGAWKDTKWEPFSFKSYFRSPMLAGLWALPFIHFFSNASPILISLSAVSMERLTVECWKGLIRKMPSKFKSEEKDSQWIKRR